MISSSSYVKVRHGAQETRSFALYFAVRRSRGTRSRAPIHEHARIQEEPEPPCPRPRLCPGPVPLSPSPRRFTSDAFPDFPIRALRSPSITSRGGKFAGILIKSAPGQGYFRRNDETSDAHVGRAVSAELRNRIRVIPPQLERESARVRGKSLLRSRTRVARIALRSR